MGIHGLNPFIRKVADSSFRKVRVDNFAKTRIAVDAPLWSYSAFSAAYKYYIERNLSPEELVSETPFNDRAREYVRRKVWNRAYQFVAELVERGITPVFVFDGTSASEKTGGARKRREDARGKIAARIEEMRQSICELPAANRRYADLEAMRKLLTQSPPVNPKEDLPFLRRNLESLGVPCIDAPDEAEKFCAYLASLGIAAASWTTDTDSFVFGAPIFITGYSAYREGPVPTNGDKKHRFTHFETTMPPLAMRKLGMTREQFTDMCIMFECDFNSRMPGIGPDRAAKMIRAAIAKNPGANRLIELAAVERPDLPWHLLNAERCRSIFLDHSECEATLSELEPGRLDLDRGRCSKTLPQEFEQWLAICGEKGAKNVKILSSCDFPRNHKDAPV